MNGLSQLGRKFPIHASFGEVLEQLPFDDYRSIWAVPRELTSSDLEEGGLWRFARLLAPKSDEELKAMAVRAHQVTRERFGSTIQLYAPAYLSNECCNGCSYCGFRAGSGVARVTLSDEEFWTQAEALYARGFRHLLVVSGEHRAKVSPERLAELARQLKTRFSSVAVEVYPLEEEEYRLLARSGVDGVTLYQETYQSKEYAGFHPFGPKRDFQWRLAAMERAGRAGFPRLNLGALLGLCDWRSDSLSMVCHTLFLAQRYWRCVVAVSVPRMVSAVDGIAAPHPVTDRDLIQLVMALRLVLPDSPIVVSTREPPRLRDVLARLGATIMSAGSRTTPGGYTSGTVEDKGQFDVEDLRSPEEVSESLRRLGLDPVWKDWERSIA